MGKEKQGQEKGFKGWKDEFVSLFIELQKDLLSQIEFHLDYDPDQ